MSKNLNILSLFESAGFEVGSINAKGSKVYKLIT